MNTTELAEIRSDALRLGYVLRPIPPRTRETAAMVRSGHSTSRELADAKGIKIAAAHNRMRTAERFGLIVEEGLRNIPEGGFETMWRIVSGSHAEGRRRSMAGEPVADQSERPRL